MKTLLLCYALMIILLQRINADINETIYSRFGNIQDWPDLERLGQFVANIDWFAKFEERIYLVTTNDRVYVFGNQSRTQNVLGLSNTKGNNITKPTEIVELRSKKLIKFSSGYRHMLALSKDGIYWAWGENKYGQLGVGTFDEHAQPIMMKQTEMIIDIMAADGSSFAMTREGYILSWGWNGNGQCGVGNTNHQSSPVKVHLDQIVNSLHSTHFGTCVAVTNNSLYIWGTEVNSSPILSSISTKYVNVASTWHKYYILTEDGHILRSIKYKQQNVEIFYNGTIKFTKLYSDQYSFNGFLIGESVDGQLWKWKEAEISNDAPVLIKTKDIVHAFAIYRYKGYQPFMIKLNTTTAQ